MLYQIEFHLCEVRTSVGCWAAFIMPTAMYWLWRVVDSAWSLVYTFNKVSFMDGAFFSESSVWKSHAVDLTQLERSSLLIVIVSGTPGSPPV